MTTRHASAQAPYPFEEPAAFATREILAGILDAYFVIQGDPTGTDAGDRVYPYVKFVGISPPLLSPWLGPVRRYIFEAVADGNLWTVWFDLPTTGGMGQVANGDATDCQAVLIFDTDLLSCPPPPLGHPYSGVGIVMAEYIEPSRTEWHTEQLEELITDDLKYRNQQLKRLQNEVLDLEEMDETISLTDFTLDDFRIELLNFIENNRLRLKNSPMGLYAVVPAPGGAYAGLITGRDISSSEKDIIKPGVIYCLAQKGESEGNEEVNPLNPYFLVYIRDDGTVRYNYTNAKQILEIYRLLCQGQEAPYDELCTLFNNETSNGENMDKYSGLLKKAVSEIVQVFKKKGNIKLTTDRGAVLIPITKQINEMEDFELITWLIVR